MRIFRPGLWNDRRPAWALTQSTTRPKGVTSPARGSDRAPRDGNPNAATQSLTDQELGHAGTQNGEARVTGCPAFAGHDKGRVGRNLSKSPMGLAAPAI